MSSNMKKWLSLVTSLAVAFVMCLGCVGMFASPVFADVGDSDLEVYYNETLVGEFYYDSDTDSDHYGQIYYYKEGAPEFITNKSVDNYSAMNNKGCADNSTAVRKGPAVLDIVGACIDGSSNFSNQIIQFVPGDDYPAVSFVWNDLFNPARSYFPNANRGDGNTEDNGAAVTPDELKGDVKTVPVIIESYTKDKKDKLNGQLSFGQLSPSERTKPAWQKRMIRISDSKVPQIRIVDTEPVQTDNNSIESATANGSSLSNNDKVALGSVIQFGQNYPLETVLYYTTDGSVPNLNSAIYNWYKQEKDDEYKFAEINADAVGTYTVKTVAYSYGNTPSDPKTLTYSVTADFAKDKASLNLGQTSCAVGATPAVSVIIGSQIIDSKYYTATCSGNTKVGTGTVAVTGKDLCSGTLTKTFTVVPAKATITKAKKGKKKITVTIKSQKASGVTKYQIAYKKTTSKKWKTVTTKKTKKVIKKLKSKKKYNVKVRAYGKTGYGEYSAVKTIKVK